LFVLIKYLIFKYFISILSLKIEYNLCFIYNKMSYDDIEKRVGEAVLDEDDQYATKIGKARSDRDKVFENDQMINKDTGDLARGTAENVLSGEGGRRRRGSKKAHKGGKRHGNASLRAWVTFVKKVQKEEGIGYKEAMTVAKKRKDKGEKWRGGGDAEMSSDMPEEEMSVGGRRRRRRTHKRRGSKRHSKRRGTRRHRR